MISKELAAKLPGVKQRGAFYTCCCPAHDDHEPSLSFLDGDEGIVFHCFAGCDSMVVAEAVAELIHGQVRDFFFRQRNGHKREPAAVFTYLTHDGEVNRQVVKYADGTFRQRRPDPEHPTHWLWNVTGIAKLLYNLPELLDATVVFYCEGEKDVERLRGLGLVATTHPNGAKAFSRDYARQLAQAMDPNGLVVVLRDEDPPGIAIQAQVLAACHAEGLRVKQLILPDLPAIPGADVSDWLDAGRMKPELLAVVEGAPEWTPEAAATDIERELFEQADRPASSGLEEPKEPEAAEKPEEAEEPPSREDEDSGRIELRVQRLSDFQAKPIDWVWRWRYARGFLTGILGDGGTCKSTFDLTVMARRSTGHPMPFETATRPPATCVVLSLEDDAAHTLKPRFVAAGGDPDRLIVISSVWNPKTGKRIRQVELERDLERLREMLIEHGAEHFTISPVSAYLGSSRNSWKDSDVRAIIDPLHDMAASLNISGTLIAHPNKNTQQRAAYRMSGSQAFRNACRIVLVTAVDPEDSEQERLIIVGEKSNIGQLPPPLAFHKLVQTYAIDGEVIEAVSLDFDTDQDLDAKKYTADFLLSAPLNAEEAAEIEVAKEFLTETLGSAGERVPTVQVQKAAAALGIAKRTLERARKALKVHPEKSKVDGTWSMWISPKDHPVNQARRRQG